MKAKSIIKYLKEYRIQSRWTTFNAAFQSALAVPDRYDAVRIQELIGLLGQGLEDDLACVYCGSAAATWDHLYNNVKDGRFSGYGHRIFNLVPACRSCNERKGGKHWREYLDLLAPTDKEVRVRALERVDERNTQERVGWAEIERAHPDLASRYANVIDEVREKLRLADQLASEIRTKVKEQQG